MGHYDPFDYKKLIDTLHEAYLYHQERCFFMGKHNLTFVDHDSESSGVGIGMINLTAGNIAAQLALLATLRTAIEGVSLGTLRSEQVIAVTDDIPGVAPANAFAQREIKWLVRGVDGVGFVSTLEIPCADLALLSGGTGQMDISAGAGLALVNALNAVWMSARSGTAVDVEAIFHVGRNI